MVAGSFTCTMSLKRFKFQFRSLRFDDILSRDERKSLDKMTHISDFFKRICRYCNCKKHYIVSEFFTVGEMLEAFREICSFRKFIKSKPAIYGIKVCNMVCGRTFYTGNLEI